jgi:hypothetical protein
MRGRKGLRQRRSRGAADHGHRGNAQRPSMLRSAALTTIAVLMASTAAAAEPHGSPGVAGAQAQARMNSGADGTDGSNTTDSDGCCHDRAPKRVRLLANTKSECSRQQGTGRRAMPATPKWYTDSGQTAQGRQ